MAVTASLVSRTDKRAVFSVVHDGAAGDTLTLTSAVILAALDKGTLYNKFNAEYANQAAMRDVFGEGEVEMRANARTLAAAAAGSMAMDVDADAVTTDKPEINLTLTTGVAATWYLVLDYIHSFVR